MFEVEALLGYRFKNETLLLQALTHKSFADQVEPAADNERLEFLGDSVLSVVVCRYLFERFPSLREDRLSKIKSTIVSQKNLALWAKDIKLGKYIRLSGSEKQAGGTHKASIVTGCLEAVVGAVFLDGGLEAAAVFIERFLAKTDMGEMEIDFKSELQEIVQRDFSTLPVYRVLSEEGPSHNKIFEIEVVINGSILGRGRGLTKKEAQKAAAAAAIKNIKKHGEKQVKS